MSKRKRRAQNKLTDSLESESIKVEPEPVAGPPAVVDRSHWVVVTRSTLFTAELEAVIEIIKCHSAHPHVSL